MGYPFWVTANNLGNRNAASSLTENPIVLVFGESDQLPCTIQLLNGALPPGVTFTSTAYQITLRGDLPLPGDTTTYEFTFRASNGSRVADRTFVLQVTQIVSVFEWVTDAASPLLYVYDQEQVATQIQARVEPLQQITYSCSNLNTLTRGIQLTSDSGLISINLGWKPQTAYVANRDYVYSNNRLYQAVVSQVSGATQGPQSPGVFVVDTNYPAWQPERFYTLNSVVHNDIGKLYVCIQAGMSGTGVGPTGTSNYILDASCIWAYQSQALVWNQVPTNTSVTLTLSCAATAQTTITRNFQIELVSREAAPIWITPAGEILSLTPRELFVFQFEVQEPDGTLLVWQAANLPDWCTLSITGELQGAAPDVQQDTTYEFDISVTDQIHTQTRRFSILVSQPAAQFAWMSTPQLPDISDGVRSNLRVQAVSPTPAALITYGWVGGQLPQGLRVNADTGDLMGFVEFHAQDRIYHFEIEAHDGQSAITQVFTVKVTSSHRNLYWDVHYPLWGDFRNQITAQNSPSVIADHDLYLPNAVGWGRIQMPMITVIGGLKACAVDDLRMILSNYMHEWRMQLGDLQITLPHASDYATVDVQVRDAVAPVRWQPVTNYPQGARISVASGAQYQALNAGVSGSQLPVFDHTSVSDGNITWNLIQSPLISSSKNSPLPWYAYHVYAQGDTMIREGVTYVCVQPGVSAGTWSSTPPHQTQVSDGTVVWSRVSPVPAASNTYWPSCVTNMRAALQSQLPWSNTWGTGAQAQLQVIAGSCVAVTVTHNGTGYWKAPLVQVVSETGTGAVLQAQVGILKVDVIASTSGVLDLDEFELDFGTGEPARLLVDGVTLFDQAARITVLSPGAYDQVPSRPVQVQRGTARITLGLSVGVVRIDVTKAGTNYLASDQITLLGSEWDPVRNTHISDYDLNLALAYVNTGSPDVIKLSNNPYENTQVVINRIQVDLQGVQWQGHTRWDADSCTWDAHSTRLVEAARASECVWDGAELVWDSNVTTFDAHPLLTYPDISQTTFDQDHTLFEYYATVFDAAAPQFESRWKRSWVWFMSTHA
jgi:hypothetical protein